MHPTHFSAVDHLPDSSLAPWGEFPPVERPRRSCQQHSLLVEDKATVLASLREQLPNMSMLHRHETASPSTCNSLANIGLSQISVPLAWNSDQHFKSKGDCRTYSMFLALRTRNQVVDTKIITNIDRTMTDVVINESFVFENEPEDFVVEVSIFAARTDYGPMDGGDSLRSKITRSLGRKFGSSVKNNLSSADKRTVRAEPSIGGTYFNFLARAYLAITDAGDNNTVHDLKSQAFAELSGPPLYGNVVCRLAVLPHSVQRPLAEGVVTVHHLNEDTYLKNVFVKLQAGKMQCYTIGDITQGALDIRLVVPFSKRTRIVASTDPCSLMIVTEESRTVEASEVLIIADGARALDSWRQALIKQLDEIIIWGKFALAPMSLVFEKQEDPVKQTLSRATGDRLYDKISVCGSISRGTLKSIGPPMSLAPPEAGRGATAPVKRQKQRANVIDLFQATNGAAKNEGKDDQQFVLQLNIGDGERIQPKHSPKESVSSYRPKAPTIEIHPPVKTSPHRGLASANDGKKSWSRSLGAMIGRKTSPSQITRL